MRLDRNIAKKAGKLAEDERRDNAERDFAIRRGYNIAMMAAREHMAAYVDCENIEEAVAKIVHAPTEEHRLMLLKEVRDAVMEQARREYGKHWKKEYNHMINLYGVVAGESKRKMNSVVYKKVVEYKALPVEKMVLKILEDLGGVDVKKMDLSELLIDADQEAV